MYWPHFVSNYNLLLNSKFKKPAKFVWIQPCDEAQNTRNLPVSAKYALSYPADKSFFSVHVIDTEFANKSKLSKGTAKTVAKQKATQAKSARSFKSTKNQPVHVLMKVKEAVVEHSDDGVHVLTRPSSRQLKIWKFPASENLG